MRTLKRFLRLGLLGGAMAALLVACSLTGPESNPGGDSDSASGVIRIGTPKVSAMSPVLRLDEHLPSGWKTEITYFNAAADITNALISGDIDVGYIGMTVAISARAQGQPIVLVGNLVERGSSLVVASDSGIDSIGDLKGKKIGTLNLSIHYVQLRERLIDAGLDPDADVEIVRLTPPDFVPMLAQGAVDAIMANEPAGSQAIAEGIGELLEYPYATSIGAINAGVLSTEDTVKNKPEVLEMWAEAHKSAMEELAASPSIAVDLAEASWGVDPESFRISLDNLEWVSSFGPDFPSQLSALAEAMKTLGMIDETPDLNDLIVDRFVSGG